MFGPPTTDTTGAVPTLLGLVERLASPDLTAGDSKVLRAELVSLLDALDAREARPASAPACASAPAPPAGGLPDTTAAPGWIVAV